MGLTGGMGCGKSEAARYLESLGARHVDADAISRSLTAPGGAALPAIRARFGDDVFLLDGALDRRAMAERVFGDAASRRALEAILHPLVQRQMVDEIEAAGREGVAVTILNVPLLFESGMDVLCDETWAMSAPEAAQLQRIRARDGLSERDARARLDAQLSMSERNARASRVIDSERPIEKTRAELKQLYQQLLRRIG